MAAGEGAWGRSARREVVHAYASHDKAARVFGRPAPVSLEDGIRKMAAWANAEAALQSSLGAAEEAAAREHEQRLLAEITRSSAVLEDVLVASLQLEISGGDRAIDRLVADLDESNRRITLMLKVRQTKEAGA